MSHSQTLPIESRAELLLTETNLLTAPVRVDLLARRLGLAVEPIELRDDISGVLVVNGEHGTIGYNRQHHSVRQRFSIAHELGHYILHRDKMQLFIDKGYTAVAFRDQRSSSGELKQEREANAFAAAVLMPQNLIKEQVQRQELDWADGNVLNDLASLFEVSVQAMSFRLANLGHLELAK